MAGFFTACTMDIPTSAYQQGYLSVGINPSQTQSIASNATSVKSLASTIRCLAEISKHMKGRQRERGISDALIQEVMSDGLITDQLDSRSLHISDHVIVISSRDRVGITTFRHPLLGEWRADRSSALTSAAKNLDTAYFFFQVCGMV